MNHEAVTYRIIVDPAANDRMYEHFEFLARVSRTAADSRRLGSIWIVPDVCQSPTEHKRSRVASTQSIEFSRHIVSWFIWIEVGKIVGKIVGAWAGTLKHGK